MKGVEGQGKNSLFLLLAGVVMVLFSFYMHDEFAFVFILPMGVIFLVCSLLFYRLARKFRESK